MILSDRTKKLKSSPTLELAAKGRKLKAEGHDVISLAVGEPDWDSFSVAKQEGIESIQKGFTKYVPANGIDELRKAIVDTIKKDLSLDYSPDQVTVTSGGKFSIFACLQVLLNKTDEVLIPIPYWVSYPDMTELAEGKAVFVPSTEKNNFKITAQDLESKITKNSKLLILNSPSNPTGAMYSKQELKSIADVLKKHPQVLILSDDIYNKLVFTPDGLAPHILQVAPELKDRTIMINGASKTYAMTGWRIGWAIGPQEIISAMTKYQSQSVSCAASFTQRATFKAIVEGDKELKEVQKKLLERKNFAIQEISKVKDVSCFNPDGAFYLWINIQKCLGKKFKDANVAGSREFSNMLLEDQKVIAVPGAEFGQEGYIRLSFAIENSRMTEAFRRMNSFIESLK
jgi:aspartate aminotransferase